MTEQEIRDLIAAAIAEERTAWREQLEIEVTYDNYSGCIRVDLNDREGNIAYDFTYIPTDRDH